MRSKNLSKNATLGLKIGDITHGPKSELSLSHNKNGGWRLEVILSFFYLQLKALFCCQQVSEFPRTRATLSEIMTLHKWKKKIFHFPITKCSWNREQWADAGVSWQMRNREGKWAHRTGGLDTLWLQILSLTGTKSDLTVCFCIALRKFMCVCGR